MIDHARATTGLVQLDLGCGYYKKAGHIGIDNFLGAESQIQTETGADIEMDMMTAPLPFADGSVDVVHSCHFLEHVDIGRIISEAKRVLKPTGTFVNVLPYAFSAMGLYPGHGAFYTDQWFLDNKFFQDRFAITEFRFRVSKHYQALPFMVRSLFPFEVARQTLMNACDEMVLVAVPREAPGAPSAPRISYYEA